MVLDFFFFIFYFLLFSFEAPIPDGQVLLIRAPFQENINAHFIQSFHLPRASVASIEDQAVASARWQRRKPEPIRQAPVPFREPLLTLVLPTRAVPPDMLERLILILVAVRALW